MFHYAVIYLVTYICMQFFLRYFAVTVSVFIVSLALKILVSAADKASSAGFWAHFNIVTYYYYYYYYYFAYSSIFSSFFDQIFTHFCWLIMCLN